jgi:cellobiose-specific phosphotransferase system component IIA
MGVEQKREAVLEKIYDELLEDDGLTDFVNCCIYSTNAEGKKGSFKHPYLDLLSSLENARAQELELKLKAKEAQLKDDAQLFENANKEIDRKHEFKTELLKLAVTSGVSAITTAMWGLIFVHELKATRVFELDGTEGSAAGRWLKNSFPKPRVF